MIWRSNYLNQKQQLERFCRAKLTSTFIIPDITRTSSNNCLIFSLSNSGLKISYIVWEWKFSLVLSGSDECTDSKGLKWFSKNGARIQTKVTVAIGHNWCRTVHARGFIGGQDICGKSGLNLRANGSLCLNLDSMHMLQIHAPVLFSVIVFILMRFRPSTLIRYGCVFVLIHFQGRVQNRCVFDETLSVLVWTEGVKASKCMRFQTKTHYSGRGL